MWYSLLLTACAALAQAETPAADLPTTVRQLVRDLDAVELATREEAEQKLLDLGPAVLGHLPAVTSRTSAEVKERLNRVRDKLQRAQAEAAVQASVVTLPAGEMPLSQALAKLAEQTGNKIVDYREQFGQPARDPAVALSLDKVPFWQALDETLDASGSTLYPYADEEQMALAVVDRAENELPRGLRRVSYAGPFRLEATQLEALRDLRNAELRQLVLQLEVAWEPRLLPINLEQALADVHAVDESGNEIGVSSPEETVEIPVVPGTYSTEMRIPFALPPRSSEKIASLRGKFTALMPGPIETFRFTDLKKPNQQQPKAGVTVILEQVRKNNDAWEIRVRVRFDETSGALESHRGWIFNNEAFLETASGEPIPPDGIETTRQTEDEVGVAYLFGLDGGLAGHTFVYKTPAVIVSLPLEYELKDLELP